MSIPRAQFIGYKFFEYLNDKSNQDEEDIPPFRGCVSVTYHGEKQIEILDVPANAKLLFSDLVNSRPHKEEAIELYMDAKNYNIPIVINLMEHPREIELLFHHIAKCTQIFNLSKKET